MQLSFAGKRPISGKLSADACVRSRPFRVRGPHSPRSSDRSSTARVSHERNDELTPWRATVIRSVPLHPNETLNYT